MDMRTYLSSALKDAMKDKNAERLGTLRLIHAAIKDREIDARGQEGEGAEVTDADILMILSKMVKQRHESARQYEEGGRLELAEKELAEIEIIGEFLPKALSDDEVAAAIDAAIAQAQASSVRDMGAVMGVLKAKYTGQMDFGKIGPAVKAKLS